jgi:hypothetical protein
VVGAPSRASSSHASCRQRKQARSAWSVRRPASSRRCRVQLGLLPTSRALHEWSRSRRSLACRSRSTPNPLPVATMATKPLLNAPNDPTSSHETPGQCRQAWSEAGVGSDRDDGCSATLMIGSATPDGVGRAFDEIGRGGRGVASVDVSSSRASFRIGPDRRLRDQCVMPGVGEWCGLGNHGRFLQRAHKATLARGDSRAKLNPRASLLRATLARDHDRFAWSDSGSKLRAMRTCADERTSRSKIGPVPGGRPSRATTSGQTRLAGRHELRATLARNDERPNAPGGSTRASGDPRAQRRAPLREKGAIR